MTFRRSGQIKDQWDDQSGGRCPYKRHERDAGRSWPTRELMGEFGGLTRVSRRRFLPLAAAAIEDVNRLIGLELIPGSR